MELFIGNLGQDITAADLVALFSAYGLVTDVDVPADDTNTPRGYAYVRMCNPTEAALAIRGLNKKQFMGQYLSVSEAIHSTPCYTPKAYAHSMGMVAAG